MVGEVVTLTATVTSNGEPVAVGTLTFLSGKQVLATVQVVQASGTATLKTRFAPGMFQLNAQYNANNLFQASQSGPQQLTVTGTEPTLTTLTAQPDGNNFDFTATVFGFGFPVPTGLVTFNDLTDGFNLGTVVLAGPGMSTFQPQQTFLVGNEPLGVAVGDFNGDGFADLAVANQPDNTISVLLGKGDGTLPAAADIPGRRRAAIHRGRRFQRRWHSRFSRNQLRRRHGQRTAGQRRRYLPAAADISGWHGACWSGSGGFQRRRFC